MLQCLEHSTVSRFAVVNRGAWMNRRSLVCSNRANLSLIYKEYRYEKLTLMSAKQTQTVQQLDHLPAAGEDYQARKSLGFSMLLKLKLSK
jgi:hypothetical protein